MTHHAQLFSCLHGTRTTKAFCLVRICKRSWCPRTAAACNLLCALNAHVPANLRRVAHTSQGTPRAPAAPTNRRPLCETFDELKMKSFSELDLSADADKSDTFLVLYDVSQVDA